jgi:ABC-type multidrug transport system ATPase subunit
MPSSEALLKIVNIAKRFGDVKALKGISITVDREAVVSLLSPNGSGKTTLMRIVIGVLKLSSSKVVFKGRLLSYLSQEQGLFEELSGWTTSYSTLGFTGERGPHEGTPEELKKRPAYCRGALNDFNWVQAINIDFLAREIKTASGGQSSAEEDSPQHLGEVEENRQEV